MSFIDPGTNPTLSVATRSGASGSNIQIVQGLRRGTTDYDSGIVSVGNGSPVSVTGTTIYPEGGVVVNTSASARILTITDGADNVVCKLTVQANHTIPVPVPLSGSWAGWKVGADGSGLSVQIAGGQ